MYVPRTSRPDVLRNHAGRYVTPRARSTGRVRRLQQDQHHHLQTLLHRGLAAVLDEARRGAEHVGQRLQLHGLEPLGKAAIFHRRHCTMVQLPSALGVTYIGMNETLRSLGRNEDLSHGSLPLLAQL